MQTWANPREKSLGRGNALLVAGVLWALWMSHAPELRRDPWLSLPLLLTIAGTIDTVRNIRPRWSLYHGAVLLCIYMDLMAVALVLFLLTYPYLELGVR